MFKKKLLTVAALAFCAAIVTAATPTSQVKKATANLIGDGAIDDLAFGNEEGKGIFFGQVSSSGNVELGWGKAFSDTLWISLYDGIDINGTEKSKESVTKVYGFNRDSNDEVNYDYFDERPRTLSSDTGNNFKFYNDFAVGVGLNNKFGVQAVWTADWAEKKNVALSFGDGGAELSAQTATVKDETTNSSTGLSTSKEFSKIKNFNRKNTITFNFKGAGIEDDDEVAFYAKLNSVYTDLNFNTKSNNYTESTTYLGATKESITADGINQTITIRPGLEAEVGFNLANWGVAKPKVYFQDNFKIGFDIVKDNTNYNKVVETSTTRTTTDKTYEKTPGKKLDWSNTFTPAFVLDFDLLDNLTLKAGAGVGVNLSQQNVKAYKTKVVTTTTTYNKATGLSSSTTSTVEAGASQDTKTFTTSVNPGIALGLVYGIIPEKTNINFGVAVNPGQYKWTTTETTNSNINTVTTTDSKDINGETSSSRTVSLATAAEEKLEKEFNAGTTTARFNIGATWFFTENAKLDVYYANDFSGIFNNANTFGIDFAVMF